FVNLIGRFARTGVGVVAVTALSVPVGGPRVGAVQIRRVTFARALRNRVDPRRHALRRVAGAHGEKSAAGINGGAPVQMAIVKYLDAEIFLQGWDAFVRSHAGRQAQRVFAGQTDITGQKVIGR